MADVEQIDAKPVEERKRLREEDEGPSPEITEKKLCAEESVPETDTVEVEKASENPDVDMKDDEGDGETVNKAVDASKPELQDAAEAPKEVKVGPKTFTSSMDMFNFFYELCRAWPLNVNVNKYEHLMLEDLIKKGHQEPEKKIGAGIAAFQVRNNPVFYSRCYYILRADGSVDDFSYRKCVDSIMPLPEEFKARSGDLRVGNKGQGGHKGQHGSKGRGGGRFGGGRGGHGKSNRGRGGGGRRF